jgi:hypothetical protein
MDLLPWILIIQLWTDPPPTMKFVYKKEYPNYQECMQAHKEWSEKHPKLMILCSPKFEKQTTPRSN